VDDGVFFWDCVEVERAKEVKKRRAKMKVKDLIGIGGVRECEKNNIN